MNIVGVVAEFNPFHKGHIYLIKQIREKFKNCKIIVAMSGNVVQRGEFSVNNKFKRANDAIENDVDLVVEIPSYEVLNNANVFCKKAIEILNYLGVTDIVFGSESNNLKKLKSISKKMLSKNFDSKMKELVKKYQSYPKAFEILTKEKINPNDKLGVCYIYEIEKNKYKISYNLIKRNKKFESATNIRKKNINKKNWINMNSFYEMFLGKILTSESNDNLIKYLKNICVNNNPKNWHEFINLSSNKSYTKSRISREVIKWVLNLKSQNEKYRILSAKRESLYLIKNKSKITTKFNPNNKNQLKISNFISKKHSEYKEMEINNSVFIK